MMNFMPTTLGSRWIVGWRSRKKVLNPSGLRPAGHAVLCEPYEPEFDAAKRIGIVIPDKLRNQSIMVEMRVRVLELGPMAYRKDNQTWLARLLTPFRPRCRPGDKIMVNDYCGAIVMGSLDGKQYRLVNDEDVFVVIESEAVKPEFPH
jgi:co-chaperonin GroES (HSP10)